MFYGSIHLKPAKARYQTFQPYKHYFLSSFKHATALPDQNQHINISIDSNHCSPFTLNLYKTSSDFFKIPQIKFSGEIFCHKVKK
jgi:hypothetical protein